MNRVHEQCPKIRLRKNTDSNRAKNRFSAPSALPAGPVARPGRSSSARVAPSATCLHLLAPARALPCPARTAEPRAHCRTPRALPPNACLPSARAPERPGPLRPCRARLRPCRAARPAPSPASAQMGSSPFQVSAPKIIFFFFLFPLVPATRKFEKYLYIFLFPIFHTQINL